jgi:hypothetical protein
MIGGFMSFDIYKKDLENRFPSYTFDLTTIGSQSKFEATETLTGEVKASSTMVNAKAAVMSVREQLGFDKEVLPRLTAAQISALSNCCDGTPVWNITTNSLCVCTDSGSNTWS